MRVPFDEMKAEFFRVLAAKGFDEAGAEHLAETFAANSRDGVYSHGLNRFPRFIEAVAQGTVIAENRAKRVTGFGALEQWDGMKGPGILNAQIAMNRAMELADLYGIGCVALRNNNHWMRGGAYGWQAADRGYIGICFTNTGGNMPPWGGVDGTVGNNPFILAVPHSGGNIVVDVAMSQYSYGRLSLNMSQKKELPYPGGFDRNGELTKNAEEIYESGRVLPIGYWKGSSMSIAFDMIASVLSAGNTTAQVSALEVETCYSQTFIAISPQKVTDETLIEKLISDNLNFIKSSQAMPGYDSVRYPGEGALATRKENLLNGIPVDESIWKKVKEMK